VSWPDYEGKTVGFAKIMGELPLSDGSLAYEIINFNLTEEGFLESRFRIMPLIPDEWDKRSGGEQPSEFRSGVLAMKHFKYDGESPELLFLTNDGVFRYMPGFRSGQMPYGSGYPAGAAGVGYGPEAASDPTSHGIHEELYTDEDNNSHSVVPQGSLAFPPQMETVGNRVYFTFCDGGQAFVWDGSRIRDFGYSMVPSPPASLGPAPNPSTLGGWANGGGFSNGGRIGTLNHTLAAVDEDNQTAVTTGGIQSGLWYYAVAFENTDGAYSATSDKGGRVQIFHHVVPVGNVGKSQGIDYVLRSFWVNSIPKGPAGTRARVILRTMDLRNLPTGASGVLRFLHRIPNNVSTEYIDSIPDGELGLEWEDRRSVPVGFYFMKFFSGSMFIMRTEQAPARVWWSEQGNQNGATPESFISSHWRDVFPETGPITGSMPAYIGDKNIMLIFKENATHYVTGDYPEWGFGTVSRYAGCAGPNLAQVSPDGSIVWYGNGTFWKMSNDGSAVDIGAPVRRRLRKVNDEKAKFGVSWVDRRTKEMTFVLPSGVNTKPNLQFVWDYQNNGWRLRNEMKMDCVELVDDLVLVGGSWRGRGPTGVINAATEDPITTVWVYGRGYPGYDPSGTLDATYTTGWMGFSAFGPEFHDTHRAAEAIFTMEERSGRIGTVKTYIDWSRDDTVSDDLEVALVHPENNSVPVFLVPGGVSQETTNTVTAQYGIDKYRTRRPYTHRLPIDIPSCTVFSLSLTASAIDSPMALMSIDAYGPTTSLPGSRSPNIYEGSK